MLSKPLLVVCLLVVALLALATGCKENQSEPPSVGDNAPSFTLTSYNGTQVALSDLLGEKSVLLYFHMAYGWDTWMSQIVDLEGSQKFQSLGVELVSIATDPISQLQLAARRFSFSSPFLSDAGGKVSRAYGVLRWAHNGEPGHTFVLVGKDGKVKWIRDYGAPENGGLMYVPVEHLYQQVAKYLSVP